MLLKEYMSGDLRADPGFGHDCGKKKDLFSSDIFDIIETPFEKKSTTKKNRLDLIFLPKKAS